jgi:hypothetical protein
LGIIPVLTERIIEKYDNSITLEKPSKRRPRQKGNGFIKHLPKLAKNLVDDDVDILVAVVDADVKYGSERRKLLSEVKEKCSGDNIALCIADGLAINALEAWLLADENALFKIYDGSLPPQKTKDPEKETNPKEVLSKIILKLTEGIESSYTSRANELANEIDLQILKDRCGSFGAFATNIINCLKKLKRD